LDGAAVLGHSIHLNSIRNKQHNNNHDDNDDDNKNNDNNNNKYDYASLFAFVHTE
jgi:hypothetical protein